MKRHTLRLTARQLGFVTTALYEHADQLRDGRGRTRAMAKAMQAVLDSIEKQVPASTLREAKTMVLAPRRYLQAMERRDRPAGGDAPTRRTGQFKGKDG